MAKDRRTAAYKGTLFVLCVILGMVVGLFFDFAASLIQQQLAQIPNLREDIRGGLNAVEPWLSHGLVGLVLGLVIFLLISQALTSFSRGILSDFTRMLRSKGHLPFAYKPDKKLNVYTVHENLSELLGSYVDQLHQADSEKSRYQEALGKYVDPTVASAMAGRREDTNIPSARKSVAVLFADLRGFTAMSELLLPEEVVMILNEHFTASTRAITTNKGNVNKFIGDAVMALFEEPPAYRQEESAARRAITAGLEMLERFNVNVQSWTGRVTKHVSFGLGVGVHSGQVILGNIGSAERLEYTAIGDTVNTSSRLCSMAKNGQVVTSQEAFEQVSQWFEGDAQQPVALKGKTGLYTTYVIKRKSINR